MVTSEYSFSCEPYRRVPVNSATTHKDWTEYNSYGTISTYSYWSKPVKPTVTTRYIDGTTLRSQYDCVYSMKDLFPKSKGRQKPSNSSNKKDAREAYMSLLPVDTTTVRAKTTQNPGLPQMKAKSAGLFNTRSNRSAIFDDHSQPKFYARSATTNTSVGWVRRYKSINESQILRECLRDPSYENGPSIKKRSYQQLFVSSSTSSFNKRRREKC